MVCAVALSLPTTALAQPRRPDLTAAAGWWSCKIGNEATVELLTLHGVEAAFRPDPRVKAWNGTFRRGVLAVTWRGGRDAHDELALAGTFGVDPRRHIATLKIVGTRHVAQGARRVTGSCERIGEPVAAAAPARTTRGPAHPAPRRGRGAPPPTRHEPAPAEPASGDRAPAEPASGDSAPASGDSAPAAAPAPAPAAEPEPCSPPGTVPDSLPCCGGRKGLNEDNTGYVCF